MVSISERDRREADLEQAKKRQKEEKLALLLVLFLRLLKKAVAQNKFTVNLYTEKLANLLYKQYIGIYNSFKKQVLMNIGTNLSVNEERVILNLLVNWGRDQAEKQATFILQNAEKVLNDLKLNMTDIQKISIEFYKKLYLHFKKIVAQAEVQFVAEATKEIVANKIMQMRGVTFRKTWLTVGDDRVREWHQEADGQTVNVGLTYTVGPDKLLFPRDPSGSLANIMGCRCTSVIL